MRKLLNTIIVSVLLTSSPLMAAEGGHVAASPAGDKVAGETKAAACVGCHGVGGASTNPEWPKLAGQNAGYIYKQLVNFKSKERDNAVMYGMVAALNDQDMLDLAAYFSSQPVSQGSANIDNVDRGRRIYRAGNQKSGVPACTGCHAPNGAGNPAAKFPALGGQHAAYVTSQLKAYRSGVRSNDLNEMMRLAASKLTDKEIEDLAQYIAGLH